MNPPPLQALLEQEAPRFAVELARLAHQRGLAVTNKEGQTRPIPVTATPVVLSSAELRRRVSLSAHLSRAAFKMSQALLRGPSRETILSSLSPLERSLAERTHAALERLVTTRVDFFVADQVWGLEVNATIPAMQGYSDIAARTFLEVVGRALGFSADEVAKLQAENGENTRALYRALLAGYAAERPGQVPKRMALLCRRHDAQLTEQRYLAQRFGELGTEAHVIHPDELSGDDCVRARGLTFDLVYRHLFVRRLEEQDAPYVRQLFSEVPGRRAVLLNPPCAQVEVKLAFALLSQSLENPALAEHAELSLAELDAIRAAVPWTRPFRRSPAVDPDGLPVEDLVERVQASPERFVLKRSWDYGGKAVFVGAAQHEPSFQERVAAAYGAPLDWKALCTRASEDTVGGGYVVQELVRTAPEPHVLCTESGPSKLSLYVDFSAYASVGLDGDFGWGGVCRGSVSQIVNIVGGGGVLPLLTLDVANQLLERALLGPLSGRS